MIKKLITPDGKIVVKNILIAVTTSVIGATLIYFLGFNSKKSYSKEEQEEVTRDAWRTYITADNIYTSNTSSILRDVVNFSGLGDYLAEIRRESEKFKTSLKDLSATGGLDKNMVSLLKRRLESEKKDWPETEKFYTGLEKLEATSKKEGWTKERLLEFTKEPATDFVNKIKDMHRRSAIEIEEAAKKLAGRYEQPFNPDDFLTVQAMKYKKDIFNLFNEQNKTGNNTAPDQPANAGKDAGRVLSEPVKADKKYFVGKWEGDGTVVLLYADGKSTWSIPANNIEVKGEWEFDNGLLIMNIKKHPVTGKEATWNFFLSNVMTNSVTIAQTEPPYKPYNLERK